jgi:Mg2+ and Co2+ transporter CorA
MNLRHVSISAVRHLQEELYQIEEQAKMETEDSQTYSLGLLRKDLVEECRRRLMFITYMIKDAQKRSDKKLRHRDES